MFLVAAWLLGDSIGSRRAYVREIEEKAERLEREREAEAQRAAAEEQARIARELHDVVAHALSVIVVQAAAADDVFEVEPRRAREPIRAIEIAARAALGDLRRVLGILQDGRRRTSRSPASARLDGLVEQVRATGLDGRARDRGRAAAAAGRGRPLRVPDRPGGADEHAQARGRGARDGARPLRRRARRSRSATTATAARPPATGGSGLIGMRERVAMLGGSVDAGRAPGRRLPRLGADPDRVSRCRSAS